MVLTGWKPILRQEIHEGIQSNSIPRHLTKLMSISPTVALAALPAIRIASESVKGALSAGVHFAKHLADGAKSDAPKMDGQVTNESPASGFDRLLPQLQRFLESIGAQPHPAVELQTDGQGTIAINAEPTVKKAVENWLTEHPEWMEAWQAAAGQYLAESPIGSSSKDTSRWAASNLPSLRSQISSTTIEHWRSI